MNAAQHPRCPCCGQPRSDLPRLDELVVALGLKGDALRLFTILSAARGRYLHVPELIQILWGDDPDGGPDRAEGSIYQIIHALRIKLDNYSVTLDMRPEPGTPMRLIARWRIRRPNGGFGYQLVPEAA